MARTSTRIRIARVAGASAAVAVAAMVMTAAPAGAATAALGGGPCGATFEDGGAVTAIVHTFVEPLIAEPGRQQVHTLSCSVAYIGQNAGIDL